MIEEVKGLVYICVMLIVLAVLLVYWPGKLHQNGNFPGCKCMGGTVKSLIDYSWKTRSSEFSGDFSSKETQQRNPLEAVVATKCRHSGFEKRR